MYGIEIYEKTLEDFRQYIEDMEFAYLRRVSEKFSEGEKKWADFENYVGEQAKQGYMTKIYSQLCKYDDIGQSSRQYNHHSKLAGLHYGWYDWMHITYRPYADIMAKYKYGKHAIRADTKEELHHMIARILSEDSIEGFKKKVEAKAGNVIGAKTLYIESGDINGIVVGDDAEVKVTTFGAGGWNIQRYHYRCKVTALKSEA